MIYLSLADLANIRRRQERHAKELAADGLANVEYDNNETCWQTGIYQDGCVCEFCHHKDECSASGQEDDE